MTLATHAIVGAAVASVLPANPVLGFCAGFASHFLADAIPHYDYPILSDAINPHEDVAFHIDANVVRDAATFALDALAGLIISFAAFRGVAPLDTLFAGAIGGILPDPLQFVFKVWPHEPLSSLQRFHKWMHTSYRLREHHALALGIFSQLTLVGVVIAIALAVA